MSRVGREPWVTPGGLAFARDLVALAEALSDVDSASVFRQLVADLVRVQGKALADSYGMRAQPECNSGSRSIQLIGSPSTLGKIPPLSTPRPAPAVGEPGRGDARRCYSDDDGYSLARRYYGDAD